METGGELLAGDNATLKRAVKASEPKTLSLLMVFEHAMGAPVPFNPSIIIVAERVKDLPGIQRGRDYHFHTRTILMQSDIPVQFEKETPEVVLGGQPFDQMTATITPAGISVNQRYYATIIKGYALVVIVSSTTDAQAEALQVIVDSIRFGD